MKNNLNEGIEIGEFSINEATEKTNWHSHAGKGGNINFIEEKLNKLLPRHSGKFGSMKEMQHWISEEYGFFTKTISGMLLCWEACFAEARRDNYIAMTQSFSIDSIHAVGGMERFITILDGFKNRYCPNLRFFPEIRINRDGTVPNISEIEDILSFNYFKSVDLCGNEFIPTKLYIPIYRTCERFNIQLKAHVGEYREPESVVRDIEDLHLSEVYHGISAGKSNEVMRWLAKRNIILHVCPTSNVILNIVDDYKTHPIKVLYHNGVKVTVNTDDMLVFNKSLSQEFMELYKNAVLSKNEIKDILIFANQLGECKTHV